VRGIESRFTDHLRCGSLGSRGGQKSVGVKIAWENTRNSVGESLEVQTSWLTRRSSHESDLC
jgi:hypothetical protein